MGCICHIGGEWKKNAFVHVRALTHTNTDTHQHEVLKVLGGMRGTSTACWPMASRSSCMAYPVEILPC